MKFKFASNLNFLLIFSLFYFEFTNALIDFLDNDLAQVCRVVNRPLDVLFILDGSGSSVGGSTFDTQIIMLNKLIDLVDIGPEMSRVGVMQYSSYTYNEFLFKTFQDKKLIREAISKIRHKLGTTKTGKALEKASNMFNDPNSGSRMGKDNIAQVAIVVSDGHSHDDPIPAALRLRKLGVKLIALGIGTHMNIDELIQMTGSKEFVFQNLTKQESVNSFVETFKKLSNGEKCEFSRGGEGADIKCNGASVTISITTKNQFFGHFYVQNQFHNSNCRHSIMPLTPLTQIKDNNNNTMAIEQEISFTIDLDKCNLERQFSINPKGFLFQTNAILQFHPDYSTQKDKNFHVKCFYLDKTAVEQNEATIDWQLIKEHTQRKSKKDKNSIMPCELQISGEKFSADNFEEENCQLMNNNLNFFVGDKLNYKWECNSDNFDTYQSFLVHTCSILDLRNNIENLIIDENGCSLEPKLLETPRYFNSLTALTQGIAFRKADGDFIKMKCKLKFCDRLMGECDTILPPRCSEDIMETVEKVIEKRQAGIPIFIKSFNNQDVSPPLLKFDKTEKNRMNIKRGRINFDGQSLIQKVVANVANNSIKNSIPMFGNFSTKSLLNKTSADVKLIEIDEKLEDLKKAQNKQTKLQQQEYSSSESFKESIEEYDNNETESTTPISSNKTTKKANGVEDPFQEGRNIKNLTNTKENSTEESQLNNPELDSNLITQISLNEIILESQIMHIQNQKTSICSKKSNQ